MKKWLPARFCSEVVMHTTEKILLNHHFCLLLCSVGGKQTSLLLSVPVCPIPHALLSPVIPPSNNTALSSLVYPSAPAEEEQERWVGSSEAEDVEDRRTTLNSSFTTSILSTLHLNHPTMLPSDHLTNATEAVQDVLERWLAGRCIHHGLICSMLSPVPSLE